MAFYPVLTRDMTILKVLSGQRKDPTLTFEVRVGWNTDASKYYHQNILVLHST